MLVHNISEPPYDHIEIEAGTIKQSKSYGSLENKYNFNYNNIGISLIDLYFLYIKKYLKITIIIINQNKNNNYIELIKNINNIILNL